MYIYIHVCVYVCIYIYIHTHIYIHIHYNAGPPSDETEPIHLQYLADAQLAAFGCGQMGSTLMGPLQK